MIKLQSKPQNLYHKKTFLGLRCQSGAAIYSTVSKRRDKNAPKVAPPCKGLTRDLVLHVLHSQKLPLMLVTAVVTPGTDLNSRSYQIVLAGWAAVRTSALGEQVSAPDEAFTLSSTLQDSQTESRANYPRGWDNPADPPTNCQPSHCMSCLSRDRRFWSFWHI